MPIVSCAAFMWDGIYIGATAGRQVRDCMLLAALGFVGSYLALYSFWGVHAVYAGYLAHLIVRTAYLWAKWPQTIARVANRQNQ